jgi:uncharacterized protein
VVHREIYRAKAEVSVPKEIYHTEKRSAHTSIYYLLEKTDFSAWHKVKSDETWNDHSGDSLSILTIDGESKLTEYFLGNPLQDANSRFQVTVPANTWFCAFVNTKNTDSNYCLAGCVVAPGFEFVDFTLANRQDLTKLCPMHKTIIEKYTRDPRRI